jgi:acyl carrier protein
MYWPYTPYENFLKKPKGGKTMKEQLIRHINNFLKTEVIENPDAVIGADDLIVEDGLVDSLGIVRLLNHLQEKYQIKKIDREDVVLDNFKTINKIAAMILKYINN